MDTVELILTDGQAQELHLLLIQALGDLSSEIAATDNPDFRRHLANGVRIFSGSDANSVPAEVDGVRRKERDLWP